MYLTKLAQRTGEDSNAVTYSDLASVVQVLQKLLTKIVHFYQLRPKGLLWSLNILLKFSDLENCW